ncbi:MAG: FliM/FliN family flagellar motor switch protein [Acidobacteriota bacterium]
MKTYLECWTRAAAGLLPQALSGSPEWGLAPPGPRPQPGFGFRAGVEGECRGGFAVWADAAMLDAPLLGEGMDQKEAWGELLREVAESAAGELTAAGMVCRVVSFAPWEPDPGAGEPPASGEFQIVAGNQVWRILARDEVALPAAEIQPSDGGPGSPETGARPPRPGLELLLDVELEAALRFGSREMTLGEILDLGPGDVVQLDRHVSDPVDLIVADKIVARGEVVLVNGNFGLRVTEVAAPRNRLESIRCLF